MYNYPCMMMPMANPESVSSWSREEDKIFEQALLNFSEEIEGRWQLIADYLPGKSAEDVRAHYQALLYDVGEIESGRVEPPYSDDMWEDPVPGQISFGSNRTRSSEVERKKGIPWTEEEHRLFLLGLEKYGRGDWRSISRNMVVTRTSTQVASHAQKYFARQNSGGKKERKRSSIHDITTPATNNSLSLPSPTNVPTNNNLPSQGGFQNFGLPSPPDEFNFRNQLTL